VSAQACIGRAAQRACPDSAGIVPSMPYLRLVRREMQSSLPRLAFMAALGGVANAMVLASINAGAQVAGNSDRSPLWGAALFLLGLLLFVKTQQYMVITAAAEIEAIIHKLRVRLIDAVRRSDVQAIETLGRARIVAAITTDSAILAQASSTLIFAVQGMVLVVCVSLYIAYLSFATFAFTALVFAATAVLFHAKGRELAEGAQKATASSARLFDRFMDMLNGIKEVRLNKARSDDLFAEIGEVSRVSANTKIVTEAESAKRAIFAQTAMFLLLGLIVFAGPVLAGSLTGDAVSKSITALLFVVGACFHIVQSIPVLTNADAAADRLETLAAEIDANVRSPELDATARAGEFKLIELRQVVFRYVDKSSEATFTVGPVDFALRPGDAAFIVGGNGSGKSTFLRLLAGLYVPDAGEIVLDGTAVGDGNRNAYRALMAAIFTDYHLFFRLFGIADASAEEIAGLLDTLELARKTGVDADGTFHTLELSAGQRRRLALLVALLEHRPVLLLDEVTSDQDPDFRRKFYLDLLPRFVKAGITIVVVTHDDRYLNELAVATRKLRMDDGRLVEEG
jgi:putative ATP-binding cassette transporter